MITKAVKYLSVVIILLVGMWMLITPIYDWVLATFNPPLYLQLIVGALIVYLGVKVWKLHPW